MNNRVQTWAESYNILPESQSRFKKKRSCIDNLFVMNTIIQTALRKNIKGIYTIFVDFQKAFDSVPHIKLWNKLNDVGVSEKIIRLLKNIYNDAPVRLGVNNELTEEISITKGVLQGECTSPLLFALYISDFETYFRNKNLEGYFINQKTDILYLQYADDIVIFANTPVDVQHKIIALEEYCIQQELEISVNKTKILHFHRWETAKQKYEIYLPR